ncbi:MAG: hypothetical protein ACYSTS_08715, partial [Planctomycetota bacterium]
MGVSGGALSFDGVDDHARIVSSALLDNLSQGTIEVQINPGSDGYYHIMDKGDGDKRFRMFTGFRLGSLVRYSGGSIQPQSTDNT